MQNTRFNFNATHVTQILRWHTSYTGAQHDIYITRCSCRSPVAWRVPLVKQVLLRIPEHLRSSLRFLVLSL